MFRLFWGILLCSLALCDARVVSAEAVSSVSAADADRQALSGIALQIQARVNASHQTGKREISENDRSKLQTGYSERIDVYSDVMLSGVEFHREQISDGRWKSTASFDTEKATEISRRELRQIQENASNRKEKLERLVKQGNLDEAMQTLESLEALQGKFQKIYAEVVVLEPLDDSYRFGVDVARLTEILADAIRELKISFVEKAKTDSDSSGTFAVLVENSRGIVAGISVSVEIDGKTEATAKTERTGIAKFSLDVEKLSPGEHDIVFRIRCPKFNRENSNLELRTGYRSRILPCACSFICSESAEICTEWQDRLLKAGFQPKANAERIRLRMSVKNREVFEGGERQIVRMDFLVELVGNSASFSKMVKGVGSSELQAQKNAVRKIKPEEIRASLLPLCKGE